MMGENQFNWSYYDYKRALLEFQPLFENFESVFHLIIKLAKKNTMAVHETRWTAAVISKNSN